MLKDRVGPGVVVADGVDAIIAVGSEVAVGKGSAVLVGGGTVSAGMIEQAVTTVDATTNINIVWARAASVCHIG